MNAATLHLRRLIAALGMIALLAVMAPIAVVLQLTTTILRPLNAALRSLHLTFADDGAELARRAQPRGGAS